ncbi:S9 family peptidase [Shewanella oneidensis MR-1]|uniref:Periplasmic dipeptidylpeptidase IV Dpp4 n=1 Tax=Shewanella oneidensis (strain ATCC 700550 / JCM 31522 / CIP 106686 / LMG 19005 / NCIMB 14063 / MR-1) TaxID=211586 RepID=Q8EAB7_SHEON|nr:S9 family peptidase [Shewanella oneidensis]AAN56964.1 periplasmic dipeptidylpeptidase IV Dpp4 [Shewanella oneidensis MR-1]MDX5998687.1 S9 family peptidase [Shewanella oneidensis]MEE2028417.1 Dipeptidyl aminopeptidase 4 [Shewanella oneidensis]QKG98273.1 S9 family peptidase [Shewanella oneidensis MR-1]
MTKNGLASSLRAVKLGASSLLIASQLAMISTLTTASAYALEGGMTPLTIERMNASPALAGTSPRGLKLSPDGQKVTYLAGRKDNQNFYDLWQMDVKTGKSSLLLNADKLASNELSDEEKARRERQRIYGEGIMEYFWADDSKALLIPAAGNLYYFSLADNSVSLLPIGEGFATDARLSPKGNFVSFVRDQNLYVLNLATKKLEAMTTDGGGVIKNAMAEFVAQEEMDRMTGYWWAPDESAIAFTRIDESAVELVTRNEIYADGIKLTEQRYPAAGKNNVEIQLGVVTLKNKAIDWVTLSDDKNKDIYLPRVDWLPDSKHLSFQWQSRDQQKLDLQLVALDSLTKPKTLVKERSDAWVNLNNDLHFLKQQSAFIWASERDGFNHLYLFDLKGKLKTQLTKGNWAVDELEFIDETAGWVYFTGRKDTPIEKHLYRVPLAGGNIERVSSEAGMHDPVFADNQSVYLDYFNSLSQPPQVSLHGDKGQHLAWVEQNQVKAGHPLYDYAGLWQLPEFKELKAEDGQILQTRLFKPVPFDAGKKYPAVVRVYGGPHAQLVTNSWSEQDYFTQYLVQQGYVVFQLDNRGSAHRGTKFEQVIYRHLGEAEVNDQKVGVDYLRSLPFVDSNNVAIYGHSYGGYMALMSLFKAPDYFKAAISGAPVTDWRLYDTHYTERYLAHPASNEQGYEASSLFPYVKNYQSGLLMYHGMADDNVLFENSTRVYKALQDEGKLFQMIDYPGSKHSMRGEKVRNHLYRSLADFLDRQLKNGK